MQRERRAPDEADAQGGREVLCGLCGACHYDPEINLTYKQWADHYGTVIMPARPRKPKDKSKVEVGVQIVERRILAASSPSVYRAVARGSQRQLFPEA